MEGEGGRRLLFKEELGVVDRWINRDIANTYTSTLKDDVEYVTSYLQILTIKDIIVILRENREVDNPLSVTLDFIR